MIEGNDSRNEPGPRPTRLLPILLLIAALALAIPALLVRYAPTVTPSPGRDTPARPPQRIVPAAEVPPVEPVAYVALTQDDARAFNAAVPYIDGPFPAARPFRYAGGTQDRARAVDCLAAAQLYEAGDDVAGERAVAQVIINRLRHPAYPGTVCGVVFQGSERRTGCQFSFTCDGAVKRWTPSPAAWSRAQAVAAAALSGTVDRRVGWATHYHTDWVVPYWQSSLDKLAKVGTHLFFRWTGWWGTPAAFRGNGGAAEPAIAQLAELSVIHRDGAIEAGEIAAGETALTESGTPTPVAGDANSFLVTLPALTSPDAYPLLAMEACAERPQCKYSAWKDAGRTPRALPLAPEQIATMTFAYLRDRPAGIEKPLWNCQQAPRRTRTECMKVQVLAPPPAPAAGPTPTPLPTPSATPRGPTELQGIRRRPGREGASADPNADLPPG